MELSPARDSLLIVFTSSIPFVEFFFHFFCVPVCVMYPCMFSICSSTLSICPGSIKRTRDFKMRKDC